MGMDILTKVRIAVRNTIKNKRRSVMTLASVAIGFLALSLFEGYFTYVYSTLEAQAIVGERLGHLTITKENFYEKWTLDPHKYMFAPEEYQRIRQLLTDREDIILLSPRLHINGLISNGDISHIFLGEGIDPHDIVALRGAKYADLPGRLTPNELSTSVIGNKLADSLNVKVGDEAVLLTSTVDGMVNAVDTKVGEITNTGATGTDDKFVMMQLGLARKLFDFEGADRIVVLLKSADQIPRAKAEIRKMLNDHGFNVDIRDWKQLSLYYTQVKGLFDMMYLFISIMVAGVVMASVINTIGMSISERTREIGTLRALGMPRRTLHSLFVVEGMVLVLIGCMVGIALSYLAGGLINGANITYTPPDSTVEADLIIELLFKNVLGSLVTLTVLAAFASYLPARHAAKKSIVGALGHV